MYTYDEQVYDRHKPNPDKHTNIPERRQGTITQKD